MDMKISLILASCLASSCHAFIPSMPSLHTRGTTSSSPFTRSEGRLASRPLDLRPPSTPRGWSPVHPNIFPSSRALPILRSSPDSSNQPEPESDVNLPLFRSDNGTRDSEFAMPGLTASDEKNPYTMFLASLAPGEMVGQFMATAPPRVQVAVKNTVLGLLGSLRQSPIFESNIVTSQRALASLMFQLEMTGYMFRNVEYRLGLQQSLSGFLLPPGEDGEDAASSKGNAREPKISGTIQVSIGDKLVEVDAESYVAELRREVTNLRDELVKRDREEQEQEVKDLLAYVQKLDQEDMQSLTSEISPEVLESMKSLVDTVIQGMGGDLAPLMGPDTITEIPASVLAQLCMWQLVVGYNFRQIEAREDLKKQLPEG